jgi:hypothetical protein
MNSPCTQNIQWKFKDDLELIEDDFWYDLTDGGYIRPEEILTDENQIKLLKEALGIVLSFREAFSAIAEEC